MKQAIDNFSGDPSGYAAYRPTYPDSLFEFLYRHTAHFDVAWDCGTGNGQVASVLAGRFTTVYGTDVSNDQLQLAAKKENIIYRNERSEQSTLATSSVDLITVAQAIHWFDFDAYYKEVRRVAKPGALFAAWTYNLLNISPAIDDIIHHFYFDIIYPYWDNERRIVEDGYKRISFPFEEIQAPVFQINRKYNLKHLIGYLGTWSAVKHFKETERKDPLQIIEKELETAWGMAGERDVFWPVYMRAGRVVK